MIKKLSAYVREYKLPAVLTSVFVAFEVVMEVLIPQCMAKIIDIGLPNSDSAYITKIGILMIIMALLSLMFGVIAGRNAAKAGAGFSKNLRQALFYKVQKLSFANIDKFSTASLVTRLTTDVNNVQMAFAMIIRLLVRSPMMLVSALFMCFTLSIKLSLVFVAVVPFMAAGLVFIMVKAMPNFQKMFTRYDIVNRVVQENLTNVRTVKAFVREDFETDKFEDATGQLYSYSIKAEKLLNLTSPLMQFSMYITILLISWIGAQLVIDTTLTAKSRIAGISGNRLAMKSPAVIPPASSISAINGMFTTMVSKIGRSATITASQAKILAAPFGVRPTAKYLANSRLR